MSVDNGDAVAGSRHAGFGKGSEGRGGGVEAAEDLESFPFHLFFLARDERNNIINDIKGGNAWVTSTRDGLHCLDEDTVERAKGILKGLERDDKASSGTIGVGDDKALGKRVKGALVGNEGEMGGVDGGNNEGNGGVAAVVFGIGKDDEVSFEKGEFWTVR